MPDQDTEQEPSIEEILTSIRQIISDDDEEAGEAPAEEAAPEEPEPDSESEEVIELTEKVDDEPAPETEAVSEPAPAPEPEAEPEAVTEPEPIEVEMQDSEPEEDADSLLTDNAEDAAFEAFSELAKKTAIEHNGITVEEIVRSELRPLLKGWLDKNLPSIIERLVQDELDRVAKRAMEE